MSHHLRFCSQLVHVTRSVCDEEAVTKQPDGLVSIYIFKYMQQLRSNLKILADHFMMVSHIFDKYYILYMLLYCYTFFFLYSAVTATVECCRVRFVLCVHMSFMGLYYKVVL